MTYGKRVRYGGIMSIYGVDYLAEDEEIEFLIVEADSMEDAKIKAGKEVNAQGFPKRNIIHIEKYDWLEK